MATIKRFEDIGAWKKARVLANRVYDYLSKSKLRGSKYRHDDQQYD